MKSESLIYDRLQKKIDQDGRPLKGIYLTRRVTSSFLQAIPPNIQHFDAYLYAVVKRKPEKETNNKWGKDARIDPCFLNWEQKIIEMVIPFNINDGIKSIDDLDEEFFEAIQASFIAMMYGMF
jgi:hypothetical protein